MDETDEGKDEVVSDDARKEKVPGTTIENIWGGGRIVWRVEGGERREERGGW